ncbi:MAG TPA: hypothetical protein VFO25_05335 [Candidatus Eremiobacteraceae bacterium]|nr:hypothetical protein [Candidatus Eremiobacteraceae bacterium]
MSNLIVALFAIAFGVEEAIIVLYLRMLPSSGPSVVTMESWRELCTIVVLVAVAWLAGARADARFRAFLIAFGVWDITYYVTLWLTSGTPGLTSQDVLFLIPVPWIAPVWAAMSFAAALMLLGLFGIARGRLLVAGLAIGWLSFVWGPLYARFIDHSRIFESASDFTYPLWLFVPGIALVLAALPFARRRRAL